MIIADIQSAKSNLSKLIKQAEAGEDVVITRDGKPVARLTPVVAAVEGRRPDGFPEWMGSMRGEIIIHGNFDGDDAEIAQTFGTIENGSASS